MDKKAHTNLTRRSVLKAGMSAGVVASRAGAFSGIATGGAWAAGSDKPEKEEIKIGFIALTDCASVVMASVMGFDKKYGIKITPTKESSWASVRDKLVNGELDAAHVLHCIWSIEPRYWHSCITARRIRR